MIWTYSTTLQKILLFIIWCSYCFDVCSEVLPLWHQHKFGHFFQCSKELSNGLLFKKHAHRFLNTYNGTFQSKILKCFSQAVLNCCLIFACLIVSSSYVILCAVKMQCEFLHSSKQNCRNLLSVTRLKAVSTAVWIARYPRNDVS